MRITIITGRLLFAAAVALSPWAHADTLVIPFSEIRQQVDTSEDEPDAVIRAYLAGLIRAELDAQGFDVDGGLVIGDLPVAEMTEVIASNCYIPTPYAVHTDATNGTLTIDDRSTLTLGLDSIRSINVLVDLTGTIQAATTAWVRWGQNVIFIGKCKTINTDHGWVGLTMPFAINLDLLLDLNPSYDAEQVAIVVDKYASLTGQAQFSGGDLQHDFGTASLTDVVISVFEDDLLDELSSAGMQAVSDEIARLNYMLDGLDANGLPDPAIEAFNAPTTFALDLADDDRAFVQVLLEELGIPDIVLSMVDERGIEILLQLAILEGEARDAYLTALGAQVSCDALLGNFRIPLPTEPLYTLNGQACEVADGSGQSGDFFSDVQCARPVAFSPGNDLEFCLAQFGDQAMTSLGNAAAWTPDPNQPGDELPAVASRPWTLVPSTNLDLGVHSLQGNNQPYVKQLRYKSIADVPRGNGTCELEMRVYKRDITAQGLKPIIALHGGTWRNRGTSFLGLEAGVSHLTERGFIVFAPFYRLAGDSDGNAECNGVGWREVVADVESALDWVRTNGPALGAADEKVSVMGQSAGAHLAAWLAAHRGEDIRQALLFYGPTDVLDYLAGALPAGGPYEAYRDFGLRAMGRFYGATDVANELHLEQMSFAGLTAGMLDADWPTLIPDTVFDLSRIDPLAPPAFVARCANLLLLDLGAIDLLQPPPEIVDCMKQDLSEFLVSNSFNHQLSIAEVPIFAIHGSSDSLVPHRQAVNLCSAIDGSEISDTVTDPLTVHACGSSSQVQIIRDAEHTLDLGVCLDPLCPAGPPGSETRNAVAVAIQASYDWLLQGLNDEADYAADLKADILARNAATGQNLLYLMDGASVAGIAEINWVSNLDWQIAGYANFNGDGFNDILWRNSVTGQNWMYLMDGTNISSNAGINTVSNLDWNIAGTGDYNGDGNADILWRNAVSGQNWMYLMNGTTIGSNGNVNTVSNLDWRIAGSGDYNGDGRADILWRNEATGQNWMYLMNGTAISSNSRVNTVSNLDLHIEGSGDYNGDGKSDILWRNVSTGEVWLYLMNGATIASIAQVTGLGDPNWQVSGSGDYNGDGYDDVLWRNSATGEGWLYLMNASAILLSASVDLDTDLNWQIIRTH